MNITKINPYILNNSLSGYSSQKVKPYILIKNSEYKLPNEVSDLYEQVEYLESTGEQWIDSLVKIKTTYQINLKVVPLSTASNRSVCASYQASGDYCDLGQYGGYWRGNIGEYGNVGNNPKQTIGNEYIFHYELGYWRYNNNIFGAQQSVDCPINLYIFARNYSGVDNYSTIKLYYLQIYDENNILIRNFIPCCRKADDKPGLFDTVNNIFYTNASDSTQDFIVGNTIAKYVPQKVKINILTRLPSEYQEVEYLESTGEQYIDTSVLVDDYNYSLYISMMYDSQRDKAIIGTDLSSVDSNSFSWQIYNAMFAPRINRLTDWGYQGGFSCPYDRKFELNFYFENYMRATYGSEEVRCTKQLGLPQSNNLLILWGRRDFGKMLCKIYSCIIDHNDLIIRNFIPCYRRVDNKPGLYDTVNDVFYTNANSGTSQDFIVGPNIN